MRSLTTCDLVSHPRLRPFPVRSADGVPSPIHSRWLREIVGGTGPRLCPRGIATTTPQFFVVASRPASHSPSGSSPPEWVRTAPCPDPPGFELVEP